MTSSLLSSSTIQDLEPPTSRSGTTTDVDHDDDDDCNATTKDGDIITLTSLPPSIILFHLCDFISAWDLLNFRLTSKQIHHVLHKEGEDEDESEELWKRLLKRDFGIDCDNVATTTTQSGSESNNDECWNQVLNIKFPHPQVTTLFGVDPANEEEFILTITEGGAFTVWKYWLKADLRVLPNRSSRLRLRKGGGGGNGNGTSSSSSSSSSTSFSTFIYAPYFLRAARFWQTLLRWCDAQHSSNDIGRQIRASLGTAFDGYNRLIGIVEEGYDDKQSIGDPRTACSMALLAVYAFTSGQGTLDSFRRNAPFDGLLGGYHAYRYYSSLCLIQPTRPYAGSTSLCIAADLVGIRHGIIRGAVVDLISGKLVRLGAEEDRICYSTPGDDPHRDGTPDCHPPRPDDVLRWLEEYVHRLTTGIYRVEKMGSHPTDPDAITLFPQLPFRPHVTSSSSLSLSIPSSPMASTVPITSRAVTRGVEVMGSAVYTPHGENRFGYIIYCIRLRLVEAGTDGYESEEERGFTTCQLETRHWRISDDESNHTESVDGQGVIGMYPILTDGGYFTNGMDYRPGSFYYQSCTGRIGRTGSFGGHIDFVPGSLQAPTGPTFSVDLAPFLLDSRPNYWY